HLAAELVEEAPDIDGVGHVAAIKPAMHERQGLDAAARLLELVACRRIGDPPSLQGEDARQELEAVHGPVVDLAQQQILLVHLLLQPFRHLVEGVTEPTDLRMPIVQAGACAELTYLPAPRGTEQGVDRATNEVMPEQPRG